VWKVIKSKSSKYSEGSLVGHSEAGWSDYAVVDEKAINPLPTNSGLHASSFVGLMGAPGLTAWFGEAGFRAV
jgi:NADPH-dependent curcumin reductase CurA